ncbi:hypothetical protein GCM10028803_03730 [Larkinella knui]|uniref:Uncharacterized protein n=1 Tax=Larkinella knui TaxID=2025310 RepID=A0A3P1CL19_9BACT|nr:hypothetical protein [Larkinella knui]RRB13939.1 hypothetical protein EHT87_16945 [Larkinella knui]
MMGLSDLFKTPTLPYKDASTNTIYELLFCDQIELYQNNNNQSYPWNILLSETAYVADLKKITMDATVETRAKILAYTKLQGSGQRLDKRELLAVIVEVGLDNGLDVLASYQDGSARYLNHSGKVLIWQTKSTQSNNLINNLFSDSVAIISKIGPWNKPRLPFPARGNVRITFLVSDGLYFGEGPIDALFRDALAGPALRSATALMTYLTEEVITKR